MRVLMEKTLIAFGIEPFREFANGVQKTTDSGIRYILLENN